MTFDLTSGGAYKLTSGAIVKCTLVPPAGFAAAANSVLQSSVGLP